MVDLTFAHPQRSLTVKALVDSGASFSVFRAELLDCLGRRLTDGHPVYLEGVGGRILGYRHLLPVQVGSTRFTLTAIFSQELTVSFNLVGREDFFHRFRVTFDERRLTVQLQPYRSHSTI